jgi:oxygen-independent coproporphyrinogen-3 oxidase
MKVDKNLLEKYNVPVPRYTSYPPANHFTDEFTQDEFKNIIIDSNSGKPEHIAVYIHIPFCEKICFYCGCNTCSLGSGSQIKPYIEALLKEIKMVSQHLDKSRKLTQIHFGGGTPNSIPSSYINQIIELIFEEFNVSPDAEIAMECHPAHLDKNYINDLINAGFNRISLGIQDLNLSVLKNVNRDPSAMPVQEIIDLFKSAKHKININLDFIYGLPGQNVESFSKTMNEAIALKPERLVTFSYAHVPWVKKNQLILEKKGLPSPEQKVDMFLTATSILNANGYKSLGLDHFVLEEDELYKAMTNNSLHRNFQGYATREKTGQVYAFGDSSITQLNNAYIQNVKEIDAYIDTVNAGNVPIDKGYKMKSDEIIIREVITQIMCNMKINWDELAIILNTDKSVIKNTVVIDNDILKEFEADKLLSFTENEIIVSDLGSLFIRNIAASLDPAYKNQINKYSKSV